MQITLNVKITLKVNCLCEQNHENFFNIIFLLMVLPENGIIFVSMGLFFMIKK